MTIEFKCVCGNPFRVADEHAGRTGTCPKCKMPITVPGELIQEAVAADTGPRFPRQQLMGYLQAHQNSNIFVLHPHIPPQREASARAFFQIDPKDGLLAVFHPSLLLAGEETLVLTESGFYVKKADLTRGYGSYESILEGSIHLEGSRDIVFQAVKPERYRYRILVSPGIAEYLSKILRGLQLLLNGRDPSAIFGAQSAGNVLQELRAERMGLLPTAAQQGNAGADSAGKRGLLGAFRGKGRT
jgi:hypothetical protein